MTTRDIPAKFETFLFCDPNSGCWLWTGCLHKKGYGMMTAQGKLRKTHRLSWELHRGPIPDGMHVLHKCDNPPCVNPNHLFLGTNADNVADKMAKGRYFNPVWGDRHHFAKLNADAVRTIRREKWPLSRVMKTFGISKTGASNVKRGHTWKHVEA